MLSPRTQRLRSAAGCAAGRQAIEAASAKANSERFGLIVLIIFILVPEEVLPAFLDEEWDQYQGRGPGRPTTRQAER